MKAVHDRAALDRRSFLKGALATGAAGTVGALLGCSSTSNNSSTTGTSADEDTLLTADIATGQKWAFEVPPASIADSDIANTVESDIVIVGAGTAGLVAANAAAENGAKVVLITASSINIARGGSNHAMNSKVMRANADEFPPPDTAQYFRQQLVAAGYNVDQDKWWKFAKYSEEAMDWLIDKMEAAGYQTVLEAGFSDPDNGPMNEEVGSHSWLGGGVATAGAGQQLVVDTLAANARRDGVTIIYKTVAEQLVREDNNTGRVTAVIAKGEDGTYTKYTGIKAIILATGDFSADVDMIAKYCPILLPLLDSTGDQGYDTALKLGGLYKGDGQKMGLWVGAAWQKTQPCAPMLLIGAGGTGLPSPRYDSGHLGLLVNKNGYRYSNENAAFAYACFAQMHQPDMESFAIWGTNYASDAAPWVSKQTIRGAGDPTPPATIIQGWEDFVTAKTFVKADTVEGVISALGLPAGETKATVDRYNQLCANEVDEDFFKSKELLIPIGTGPFYGAISEKPAVLTVMGGLRTNINMQVCDENDEPIPGLFNIGTMVGDYFANIYNFNIEGNNLGANCVTFGYTTGKDIATGAV